MSTAPEPREPDPAPREPKTAPVRPESAPRVRPESAPPARAKSALIFDDPLDQPSSDDSDHGWGERPGPGNDSAADLKRFLDEKPPHHL